jgi:hypothetical protein
MSALGHEPTFFPLSSGVRTTAIYVESNPTRLAKILQGVRW